MIESSVGGSRSTPPFETARTEPTPSKGLEKGRRLPAGTPGLDASEVGGYRSELVRLWWVPVLLSVLVGVGVAGATENPTVNSTSAIINTRAATDEPDERFDLIRDLTAASQLPGVLEPVAEDTGLTVRELKDMILVDQVGSSSLGRITVTSSRSEEFRRGVVEKTMSAATAYLAPPSPPRVLALALDQQDKALNRYYQAIAASNGLRPDAALEGMQARLADAVDAGNDTLAGAIRKQVPRAVKRAQRFEALRTKLDQANSDLSAISVPAKRSVWTGPRALEIEFQQSAAEGLTSSLPLRRGIGAGLAAGLLVAALIAFSGFARRREV